MDKPKQKEKFQTILFILFTLLVVGGIATFLPGHMSFIEGYISSSGLWGLMVCILLYGLLGLTIIPSEPLTILTGAIFGPLAATIVAGLGNTLAAVIEYFLGGKIDKMTNFHEMKEKLPFGLGKLPLTSPTFQVLARMIPGYGPKVVSVLSGAYRVPMWTYIWTAAVPSFLGAAIFAYGGYSLLKLL